MRRHHSKMVGTGMVLAVLCVGWTASARDSDTPVLGGDPGCVVERLGRVRIEVGNKAPDPRRGGHLSAVSYAKRLGVAAGERGAHAVILREHEADYFAKRCAQSVSSDVRGTRGTGGAFTRSPSVQLGRN